MAVAIVPSTTDKGATWGQATDCDSSGIAAAAAVLEVEAVIALRVSQGSAGGTGANPIGTGAAVVVAGAGAATPGAMPSEAAAAAAAIQRTGPSIRVLQSGFEPNPFRRKLHADTVRSSPASLIIHCHTSVFLEFVTETTQ